MNEQCPWNKDYVDNIWWKSWKLASLGFQKLNLTLWLSEFNSGVHFYRFRPEIPFFGQIDPKMKIAEVEILYKVQFEFAEFDGDFHFFFFFFVWGWKYPFWTNLIQKIKVISLSWNLILRLIQIWRIQWWCSFFSVFDWKYPFWGEFFF